MTAPTPDELAAIRALLDKATPRPWYVDDPIPGRPDDEDVEITAVGDPHDIGVAMMIGGHNNRPTADLITAAVNALPSIFAALDAEQQRRERVEAAARIAVDALGFWESDGETRVDFPVDRDGDSTREQEAPFVALRAALVTDASEGEA